MIMDSMAFAEEAIDSRPPGLYYIIHLEKEMHVEDTWESAEWIAYLRRLLKKYHAENPENPTATSPNVDKGAHRPPMVARSKAKVTPPTEALICFSAVNRSSSRNPLPVRVSSTPRLSQHPLLRVCSSRRCRKPALRT